MSLPVAGKTGERLRLHYLDGLRGLAALHVASHHATSEITTIHGWLSPGWIEAAQCLPNPRLAVEFFIVISGYCLMMPVARSGSLKGGWLAFIKRRARRIVPPYYAAIAFSLAIILLVPGMNRPHGLRWDIALPAFTPGVLISHLLLLQDANINWIGNINSAMWSIAQEWQIYFVFALILLPLWRRTGIVIVVLLASAVAVGLHCFHGYALAFAAPEFLFLFAFGMLAATINFPASVEWLAALRERVPWGWLALILWVTRFGESLPFMHFIRLGSIIVGAHAGVAMICTLVFCTRCSQRGDHSNLVLRVCESPLVVILGTFSYSLYLVHLPILSTFTLALHDRQVPGPTALAVEMFVALPVALACAYGFHLVAERPFMLGHPPDLARAEKAAILDTAP